MGDQREESFQGVSVYAIPVSYEFFRVGSLAVNSSRFRT